MRISEICAASVVALALLATPVSAQQAAPASEIASPAQNDAQVAPSQPVKGFAAIQALVGNTVSIKHDDTMHYDYFLANGVLKSMEESEITKGHWTAEGGKLCFAYEGEEKSCYSVEIVGADVTFTGKDGTGYRYALMRGNPKNL